jgi:hypothetical protein
MAIAARRFRAVMTDLRDRVQGRQDMGPGAEFRPEARPREAGGVAGFQKRGCVTIVTSYKII